MQVCLQVSGGHGHALVGPYISSSSSSWVGTWSCIGGIFCVYFFFQVRGDLGHHVLLESDSVSFRLSYFLCSILLVILLFMYTHKHA